VPHCTSHVMSSLADAVGNFVYHVALWAIELERAGEVDRFVLDIVNQSLDGVSYKRVDLEI
jgi:hypothetical protein